jgi:hypothetical protein
MPHALAGEMVVGRCYDRAAEAGVQRVDQHRAWKSPCAPMPALAMRL